MGDYSVVHIEAVPDIFGGAYPGEMRMFTSALDAEQVAFTHRRMPAGTGGKGSYGHLHLTQEEVYFVISGSVEMKLGDDLIEVGAGTAVRVAPQVVRSVWNEGPEDAVVVIISTRVDDPRADVELIPDFWPE